MDSVYKAVGIVGMWIIWAMGISVVSKKFFLSFFPELPIGTIYFFCFVVVCITTIGIFAIVDCLINNK